MVAFYGVNYSLYSLLCEELTLWCVLVNYLFLEKH